MVKTLASLLLLLLAPNAFARLSASLSQTEIGPNDTITLTIQSDSNQPVDSIDLSVLDADFVVGGRSTSSQISFINGEQTAVRELSVELTPKREGTLAIPAFVLNGESSSALELTVSAARQAAAGVTGSEPLVLTAEVDQRDVYVQQQVIYTLKLYFALNISDGAIDEPKVEGAALERLGSDARSQTEINGQRFQVLERRYLIIPEKSGDLLIPAVNLRARIAGGGSGSVLDSFFDRGRVVNIPSQEITLNVKPQPPSFSGSTWLPARTFALDDSLSATEARVGDAITRTLRITASGLGSAQLPALEMAAAAGLQVYPDQPSRVARPAGKGAVATLEQKIAIIPTQEGEFELPAIRIPWWDVGSDSEQIAEIKAQRIRVLPALNAPSPLPLSGPAAANPFMPTLGAPQPSSNAVWQALSAALLILFLGAAMQIYRLKRRLDRLLQARAPAASNESPADLKLAEAELRRAITLGDDAGAGRALIALARGRGLSVNSLAEVPSMLADGALKTLVGTLATARFAPNPERLDLSELKAALKSQAWQSARPRSQEADALPPLYRT